MFELAPAFTLMLNPICATRYLHTCVYGICTYTWAHSMYAVRVWCVHSMYNIMLCMHALHVCYICTTPLLPVARTLRFREGVARGSSGALP